MNRRHLNPRLAAGLILVAIGILTAAKPVSFSAPAVVSALKSFTADGLKKHIVVLADDAMQGREAGTEGHLQAARYMAEHFAEMGLLPAGNNETFFQNIEFRISSVEDATLTLTIGDKESEPTYIKEFVAFSDPARAETEVGAEIIFVGYGVSAPSMGYDDYAEVNVEGKIVAIFAGTPEFLPPPHRAHLGRSTSKEAAAAAHGAIGVIRLWAPDARVSWERLSGFFSRWRTTTWIAPDGSAGGHQPNIQATIQLNSELSELLFMDAARSWQDSYTSLQDNAGPLAFPLKAHATVSIKSSHESFSSPNVAAVLPGSDSALKHEYVVYTAHLDHVGMSDEGQDRVFNGAYDNATGSSTLLEIAKAFAALPRAPRRSILFVAVTAEEKGLLGSDYFAHFPGLAGNERMVANINMDMHLMLYPVKGIAALGAEHSSLGPVMRRALEHVGLEMVPDPIPEKNLFVRSDHYSFVRQGVPATFLVTGFESADSDIDGKALFDNWFRTTYHKPNDDLTQNMHLESGVKMARANFLTGYQVANEDNAPTWNEGNFFGETFGKR